MTFKYVQVFKLEIYKKSNNVAAMLISWLFPFAFDPGPRPFDPDF